MQRLAKRENTAFVSPEIDSSIHREERPTQPLNTYKSTYLILENLYGHKANSGLKILQDEKRLRKPI